MKAQTLSTLVALAASLQQVSATSGWNDFPPFTCSQNSHDVCNPDQNGGYDFSDLTLGDFSSYKSFGFSGFSCKDSPKKRTGSSFGSGGKCIAGIAHSEPERCPSFHGSGVSSFTVNDLHVRPEYDCDLEFHYGMKDGSVCKQKSSCSKEGTVVQNKQCGGAKDVTIVIINPPKATPTCSVEVHSIGFNCQTTTASSAKATTTSTTSTTSAVTTSPAAVTTSSSAAPVVPPTTSTSTTTVAGTTSTTSTTSASSTAPVVLPPTNSVTTSSTTSTGSTSTYVVPPPNASSSSAPAVVVTTAPSSPTTVKPAATSSSSSSSSTSIGVLAASTTTASLTTAPPATSVTTIIVETTVTTCPVTNTIVTGGSTSIQVTQTVSTITTTKTATVCDKCIQATSAAQATTAAPAPSGQPSVPCPAILPSCLSTWLSIVTECTSNDDSSCYCPNSNFTILVFGCLSAHGATDDDVYSAQQYFQGICAQHVSVNPAIITGAPSVTPTATTPAAALVTTIQVLTTVYVPCTQSNGPASTTTVISSAVTVPQVIFTTVSGSSVGLVPGTTPAAAATPAGALTTLATVAPTKAAAGNTTGPSQPKFTGAASRSSAAFSLIGAAAALALFAL